MNLTGWVKRPAQGEIQPKTPRLIGATDYTYLSATGPANGPLTPLLPDALAQSVARPGAFLGVFLHCVTLPEFGP